MGRINSRNKGSHGERELIKELQDHLGDEIAGHMKRNLEQSRKGGHDVAGLEGWAIEVKRYKRFSEAELARIWDGQAVAQALKVQARPALCYRGDHRPWRVRLPMALLKDPWGAWTSNDGHLHTWTADIGLEAFASVIREVHSAAMLQNVQAPPTMPS